MNSKVIFQNEYLLHILPCEELLLRGSLTYEKISENMLKMKVIQNFVLINFYIIHFIDKVCWTSQILGENSWKKCDILLFVLMHWSSAPRLRRLKQNSQQKHVTFFQDFSPRICEIQQGFSLISCCKMLFRIEKWRTFIFNIFSEIFS